VFKKLSLLTVFCLFVWNLPIFAQNVEEIVNKNIEARGGMEKLKALKSMKFTGKMTMPMQQGLQGPIVVYSKRPNYIRVEFTIQGMTGVQAYDGQTPWMIMPFMGSKDPQKMSADDAKDIIEQADFDGPLVDYKGKGNTVELIGKEDMEGTPVYKLKVTLKSGESRYFFLDAENYLDLKITRTTKREGNELTVDTFLGDYKEVNGLMVPYSVEARIGDKVANQLAWDSVEFEVPIDDSIFKMPPVESPQSQTAPSN
jgi:outer membrane lipoprotein-sorting protein